MTTTSELHPTVSVVIATYNMGEYIAQAVRSVLAQETHNVEVVVVDDGSTDQTPLALSEFRDDRRVTVIRQSNRGQPAAKNVGWKAGRGQFVAFCDADDYWLPNKLALQLRVFQERPRLGVVYSKTTVLDANGEFHQSPEQKQPSGSVLSELFFHNYVPFGTAVVRRSCLEEVGGFDESIPMGIDWDLWLRIARRWEFYGIPESTYVYRIWAGQMSHNWRGRYQCALQIMNKFVADNPGAIPGTLMEKAFADTYTNFGLSCICQDRNGLREGLSHLMAALRRRPWHWPAWRILITHPLHRYRSMRQTAGRGQ